MCIQMLQDHKVKACIDIVNNLSMNMRVELAPLAYIHKIDGKLLSFKIGGSPAICHNLDEPATLCYTELVTDRQILFDLTYMWKLSDRSIRWKQIN